MNRKKRKKITDIFFTVLTIAAIMLLLYPTVSDVVNSYNQSKVIATYSDYADKMSGEDYTKAFEQADKYNEKLYGTKNGLLYPDKVEGYDNIFNVNSNGIIGFVDIEKIGVHLPVYHSTSETVLTQAVGHLKGSSFPTDKKNVHSVIAAHRGLVSTRLFTDLDEMEKGDTFSVTVLNKRFIYEVDSIQVVLPEENSYFRIVDGENYCTLQTCTPYGVNSHRLLVRGKYVRTEQAVKEDFDAASAVKEAVKKKENYIPLIIAVVVIAFHVYMRFPKRKNKKAKKVNSEDVL